MEDKIYEMTEDVSDNIDSSNVTLPVEAPATSSQPKLPVIAHVDNTKMSIVTASQKISEHYKSELNLKCVFPLQYCDGGIVDFINDKNVVLASAKLRYSNNITVDASNGNMTISVHLSDLAFTRETLNIYVPDPSYS